MVTLLRIRNVAERFGGGRSTAYGWVSDGLLPPPVHVGGLAVWPSNEIDTLVAARIAGKSHQEIRELVKRLTAKRATEAAALLQAA